jgi:hypothetical protein
MRERAWWTTLVGQRTVHGIAGDGASTAPVTPVASVRTAERVGFRREGLLRGWQQVGDERRDMLMYSTVNIDLR